MTLEEPRCHDIFFSRLGGLLIGSDTLPPLVPAISPTAGSTQMLGNQLYGPYGNLRYSAGTIGTAKGFTGQYNDALTGLDYYVSRSYDPIIGRFLSADDVEGNLQGADPYAYVSGNPETDTDPTGEFLYDPYTGQGAYTSPTPGVAPVIFQYTVPHRYAPPVQAHLKLPTLTKVPTATRNTNNNTLDPGPCAYLGCKAGALVQTTETRWVPQTITVTHWHTVCIFICMTMPYTTSVTVWRPVQVHGVAPVTLCPLPYDCSDDNGSGNRNNRQREGVLTSSDEGGSNGADETSGPVNSHGVPYPVIIDPRTGEPVPFPDGATERIPRGDRVPWNGTLRRQFIKAWEEAGYEALNWADYEIHHILPREFGGTNDFWNLVPVESNYHRQVISPWWAGFKP
jgi:RHS repeat-associated protein